MGLKIIELRALRGPNRYTRKKAIFMLLDIGKYEDIPSNKIPNFNERLLDMLPSLKEHKCSYGVPGGFVRRLEDGTYMAHIVEHIALELQYLAGMPVKFGKSYGTNKKGEYAVVFHYQVESAGLKAAEEAIWLVESILYDEKYDLEKIISTLKELREEDRLGPTTQSIVEEAAKRGIPHIRLNKKSFVQLGYGKYQKRIQASMTSHTSALAVEIADEKARTKDILYNACIPVPKGDICYDIYDAEDLVEEIEFPVVVKPEIGNHGRGITVNVKNLEELERAFKSAKEVCKRVVVEQYIPGADYRLLVINGRFVAAAKRVPAHVIGDGKSTIEELIEKVNSDIRRGYGHENILTKIKIDEMTYRILENKKLTLGNVLKEGEILYLKTTANLSQGGTAIDVTDIVHPSIRLMAERTANIIGLDCIGIDFLGEDIKKSIEDQKCGIVEVNAAPGLRMHLQPSEGKPRNVAKPIVDMLFPEGKKWSMPIIAVTGTNGKTTTVKLMSHALKYNGKKVGMATTTGVEIDGIRIAKGDYSGPYGHGLVLKDATVEYAVLETARGGIIRRGLAFDQCDVGIFLNIGEDHIGNDLVYTLDDLAKVKSIVVEVVKPNGISVLNAEDEYVMEYKERVDGKVILFSLDPENRYVKEHVDNGGMAATVVNGNIVIRTSYIDKHVAPINDVPITFGGLAKFNIANTLAAVAALYGLGMRRENIQNAICTFHPTAKQNPGRLNLFGFNKSKVLLDYGHNKHAIKALKEMIDKLADGRKIGVLFGTGSRTDEALIEFGEIIADVYDFIILSDPDPRRREPGETPKVVMQGMERKGFDTQNRLKIIKNFQDAIDYALNIVESNELVVIQVDDEVQPIIDKMLSRKKNEFFSFSGV